MPELRKASRLNKDEGADDRGQITEDRAERRKNEG